jgi:beta-galactosidase
VSTHLDRASTGVLIEGLIGRAGITPVASADRGLELVRRIGDRHGASTSWLFAINHTTAPLALAVVGTDLVTGVRFEGAGDIAAGAVAVIREDPRV